MRPPSVGELAGRHLGVDHARRPRSSTAPHPGPMRPALPAESSCSIAPVDHVRDRLEPAVRVVGRALRLPGREIDRAHLVEQEERVHLSESRGVGNGRRTSNPAPSELPDRALGRVAVTRPCRSSPRLPLRTVCRTQLHNPRLAFPTPLSSRPMDAVAFYGLEPTEDPNHWRLPVVPDAVLGARRAVRRVRARRVRRGARAGHRPAPRLGDRPVPVVRPAAAVLDIRIDEVVRGHQISQARAVASVDGDEILTVNAALGHREVPHPGEWAEMPDVRAARWSARRARSDGPTTRARSWTASTCAWPTPAASTSSTARPATGAARCGSGSPGSSSCQRGHALDRRRLRAVRDLAGARPARRRQQPRQHAAGRAAGSRPSGSSPTSGCTRSPTASATASCTSGPRTARCSGPRASPRSCATGASNPLGKVERHDGNTDDVTAALGHHRSRSRASRSWSTRSGSRELVDLGFTDVWSAETNGTDAFTPLVLAAVWAPTLRLGQAIVPVYTRGPALLAQSIATLADIAPGRAVLGIGSSSNVIVERWNGIPFEQPYQRVRDTVRFLRVRARGREGHRGLRDVLGEGVPPRDPRSREPPPILVAALREGMLRSPAARATARSSTGSRPTTCGRSRRSSGEGKEIAARIFVLPDRGPRHRARHRPAHDRRVPERPGLRRVPRMDRPRRRAAADVGRAGRRATAPGRPRRSPTRCSTTSSSGARPRSARRACARYVDNGVTTPAPMIIADPDTARTTMRALSEGEAVGRCSSR